MLRGCLILRSICSENVPQRDIRGCLRIGALCLFLLLAVCFLDPSFGSAQETRIRAAYSAMSGSMAWVWAAKEGGYFDQHGLKVDLI
jgi:ABC-type nitrate/sulfonate/bicarbonate transport system substrate-binding protein